MAKVKTEFLEFKPDTDPKSEPTEEIKVPVPEKVVIKEVVIDQITMNLKEFTSSLTGTDFLLASAMRKEFTGLKKTMGDWKKSLKEFSNREV